VSSEVVVVVGSREFGVWSRENDVVIILIRRGRKRGREGGDKQLRRRPICWKIQLVAMEAVAEEEETEMEKERLAAAVEEG
jgi:hypothetical protein